MDGDDKVSSTPYEPEKTRLIKSLLASLHSRKELKPAQTSKHIRISKPGLMVDEWEVNEWENFKSMVMFNIVPPIFQREWLFSS